MPRLWRGARKIGQHLPAMRGRGQVRFQQGFFSIARTCPICGGTGQVVTEPCHTCHGEARVEKEHIIQVKIPAGVEDGTRIRYQGEGDAGRYGGNAGDLYVVLAVKPPCLL